MVSLTDGPCLQLVIFLKTACRNSSSFSNLNQNKNDLNLSIQMMPVYGFYFFHSLTRFFPNGQTKYICRRTILLVSVLMSVRFTVLTSSINSQGRTQLLKNCWRMLLVVCFPGQVCLKEWSLHHFHNIHVFPINFTW